MAKIQFLLAVTILCAVAVSARHRNDQPAELSQDPPIQSQEPQTSEGDDRQHMRHRRKRWYNSYGYSQPVAYRDDSPQGPTPYDPFAYIYRRLDELAALIRQPIQPPPPPPAPIFVPYPVYIPQVNCGCPAGKPNVDTNGSSSPSPNITQTIPDFPNRAGEDVDDYDDEPIRPISFTPVTPDRPLSRPPPSVEHGSSQAGAQGGQQQGRDPPSNSPGVQPAPSSQAPSRCDLAILTCCHQRYTTEQCFTTLGCPRASRSSNPCDSRAVSNVVRIFQNFYSET